MEQPLYSIPQIIIEPMSLAHLDAVYDIEARSFSIPWTKASIRQDLTKNDKSHYYVAKIVGTVAGYAGMWHVVNEGHINNIAVDEPYRRFGIGSKLMDTLIETAHALGMIGLTLEVRVGNHAAMGLYHKYGFKIEGYRKNYYADTKEDAVIMWKTFGHGNEVR